MKRIGIFYARLISLNSKIGRIIEAAAVAARSSDMYGRKRMLLIGRNFLVLRVSMQTS
jgi:hypothetical protein